MGIKSNPSKEAQSPEFIWAKTYSNVWTMNASKYSSEFLKGVSLLSLSKDELPSVLEINARLKSTGWRVEVYEAIVSHKKFFECLSQKILPINLEMRSESQVYDFAYPDFFHDVFGHLPMLFNRYYSNFLCALGEVGASREQSEEHIEYCNKVLDSNFSKDDIRDESKKHNSDPFEFLNRISWWTTDMGCILEAKELKCFGAALVTSSKLEKLESAKNLDWSLDCSYMAYHSTEDIDKVYVLKSYADLPQTKEEFLAKFNEVENA